MIKCKLSLIALFIAITHFSYSQMVIQAETQTWSSGVIETIHGGYTGSGYVNTANSAGQWIEFTFVAPGDAMYDGYLTYANGGTTNRTAQMYINGVFVRNVTFYNGTWTDWEILDFTVNQLSLRGGINKVRFVATSTAGLPNIDALGVNDVQDMYDTRTYQAENQRWSNAVVESIHSGYTGTGYVNTANAINVWIEFDVYTPYADEIDMMMWYATPTDRPMAIHVNGQFHTTRSFASTGGWTGWDFTDIMVVPMPVKAGHNKIRFIATTTGGAPNFDKIVIHGGTMPLNQSMVAFKSDSIVEEAETSTTLSALVAPSVVETEATLTVNFPVKTNAIISLSSSLGTDVKILANGAFEAGVASFAIFASDLKTGTYLVSVVTDTETITKTIIIK